MAGLQDIVWLPADREHLFFRTGDTHMYRGVKWVYFWDEHRSLLRRHNHLSDPTMFNVRKLFTGRPPRNALECAQKFYEIKRQNARDRVWRKPQRERSSSPGGPRLIDLTKLRMQDLELVHLALTDRELQVRDWSASVARVWSVLNDLSFVLVDRIESHWGGTQVRPNLWMVQKQWVPSGLRVVGERSAQLPEEMVVARVAPNPKKAGTPSAARYSLYRVGMTVRDLLAAGATRRDVLWDTERGHIVLASPAVSLPGASDALG